MKFLKCVVILLCILFVKVIAISNRLKRFHTLRNRAIPDFNNTKDVSYERFIGGNSIAGTVHPWVAGIVEGISPPFISRGIGAIVNTRWLVLHQHAVQAITNIKNIHITASGDTIAQMDRFFAHARKIVQYKYDQVTHTSTDDLIAMMKFCPSADPGFIAPMPSSATALLPGNTIRMLNYVPALKNNVKKVVEPCECDSYTSLDLTNTFCVKGDSTITFENTDLNGGIGVILSSNYYMGFCVAFESGKGDLYINLSYYLGWIANVINRP